MTSAYRIKINNDGSINLWKPDETVWRDAIELAPKPVLASNQIAIPQYNLLTTPVEITYTVLDTSIEERKVTEVSLAKQKCFTQISSIIQSWIYLNEPITITQIEQATVGLTAKIEAINSTTTHEELDVLLGI
jgi:hypothetical protein